MAGIIRHTIKVEKRRFAGTCISKIILVIIHTCRLKDLPVSDTVNAGIPVRDSGNLPALKPSDIAGWDFPRKRIPMGVHPVPGLRPL
jgi:hypothetical protein